MGQQHAPLRMAAVTASVASRPPAPGTQHRIQEACSRLQMLHSGRRRDAGLGWDMSDEMRLGLLDGGTHVWAGKAGSM
jgi:hypothetical protein